MRGVSSEVAWRPLERFGHLTPDLREALFARPPLPPRAVASDARRMGLALGAVLYSPGTLASLEDRLLSGHWPAVTAVVICLEDAIADARLEEAEDRLEALLRRLEREIDAGRPRESVPFLLVRVRGADHLERLLTRLGSLTGQLDGIVLPKVMPASAATALRVVRDAQAGRDRPLWALPILESAEVAHAEDRTATLLALREEFRAHADLIASIRVGATDLSGLWGLRRTRDFSIYDVGVVANVIFDIVNVFGREDGFAFISGPVWEYVSDEPLFKPPLRETPFLEEFGSAGSAVRERLLNAAVDGLVRETLLDRLNGLHGKTVIHPAHVAVVDAAYAVSHDEYEDASAIVASGATEGVFTAGQRWRMNEPKPHAVWARRTVERAEAFGVLRPEHTFLALLAPGGFR